MMQLFPAKKKNIRFSILLVVVLFSSLCANCRGQGSATKSDTVRITVDLAKELGPMNPIWAYFGYDEPNYTYMKNGRKLVKELSELSPVPVHIRSHNFLNTGDGVPSLKWGSTNVYTEDSNGNPVYDWKIIDKIFDTYVHNGIHPIVEIGFMPKALSANPVPYKHHWKPGKPYKDIYTGWAYPPTSYEKWGNVISKWVTHCVDRYGKDVVSKWQWEVWNEPNIGYWQGTETQYFKLYDYTAAAVKEAFPEAKVGGPAATGPGWDKAAKFLKDFLDHCENGKNYKTGKTGAPLDFISYHAKGNPKVVDGHIRMGINSELSDVETGFRIISSYQKFKHLPVIISECDPEGCAACSVKFDPNYAYRNGTMYPSYTAAAFSRIYQLSRKYNINLQGALTWAFEFENHPWFAGFRDLATNGVDKPILNIFRMFGMMQGRFVETHDPSEIKLDSIVANGTHGNRPDIGAMATISDHSASIMVWNYDDDAVSASGARVSVTISDLLQKRVLLHHYRIDEHYSNAYQKWLAMGKPKRISEDQYRTLERAGQLQQLDSPKWIEVTKHKANIRFSLPRHGVSLLKLSW